MHIYIYIYDVYKIYGRVMDSMCAKRKCYRMHNSELRLHLNGPFDNPRFLVLGVCDSLQVLYRFMCRKEAFNAKVDPKMYPKQPR